MSEFNSALGLLQLKYVDQSISRRKEIDLTYRKLLEKIPGIKEILTAQFLTDNILTQQLNNKLSKKNRFL